MALGARHLTRVRHGEAPTSEEQYLFFQTIVGAWPFEEDPQLTERIREYMLKAAREAKIHTSWTSPQVEHEEAIKRFVTAMLAEPELVASVSQFVDILATHGACNSLSQLALKLASPGVPDIYQGTELWDFSLVDPDNRRRVDFARRRELLDSLAVSTPEAAHELVTTYTDGRIKLHVTSVGLRMRRERPLLFLEGSYRAIESGPHVIAFERAHGSSRLVCVVPRLTWRITKGEARWPLGAVWGDREIDLGAPRRWRNAFTSELHEGSTVAASMLFARFPIAWLVSDG
jgi:(1->4)-alpha-D-glucan 1-alpha-D-glucosylmutase